MIVASINIDYIDSNSDSVSTTSSTKLNDSKLGPSLLSVANASATVDNVIVSEANHTMLSNKCIVTDTSVVELSYYSLLTQTTPIEQK